MVDVKDMDQEDFFGDVDVVDVVDASPIEEEAVEEEMSKSTQLIPESEAELTTKVGLGGIGLDFSSLAATLPGVAVGNTGLQVSRFPVERIKFSKSQKVMISILSDQVIAIKTHYDETHGSFLCFGGACCEKDFARVKYVYPIVRYACDSKGIPIVNVDDNGKPQHPLYDVMNMCLSVGQETYDNLVTLQELKGSLTNLDILVTCSDEQYQKISIQEATSEKVGGSRYKRDPQIVKAVEEFWKQNGKSILRSVARKVTPDEYAQDLAVDMTVSTDVDFDDVFKD